MNQNVHVNRSNVFVNLGKDSADILTTFSWVNEGGFVGGSTSSLLGEAILRERLVIFKM